MVDEIRRFHHLLAKATMTKGQPGYGDISPMILVGYHCGFVTFQKATDERLLPGRSAR